MTTSKNEEYFRTTTKHSEEISATLAEAYSAMTLYEAYVLLNASEIIKRDDTCEYLHYIDEEVHAYFEKVTETIPLSEAVNLFEELHEKAKIECLDKMRRFIA